MEKSQLRKNIRKCSSINLILIISVIVFTAIMEPLSVRAENNSTLKQDVIRATFLLEKVMQSSYDQAKKEVENSILENKYDYELTMQSFYEKGTPFNNYDYVHLIAAYIVAKQESKSNGISMVPFVKPVLTEKEILEYKTVIKDKFIENENGSYIKDGLTFINYVTETPVYEELENGLYEKTESTELITPEQKTIKYAEVSFQVMQPEEIFGFFGVKKTDKVLEEYKRQAALINSGLNSNGLSQSIFVRTETMPLTQEEQDELNILLNKSENSALLQVASSLIGRVPYTWGGKSTKAGFDKTWWTFDDTGIQKGLDCSGYVQWVYRTLGYEESVWGSLVSTSTILKNTENTTRDQLQVGDLGLLNSGDTTNHVGIYVGDDYWIHCSSSKGTVTLTKDFPFTIYKKVPNTENGIIDTDTLLVYYTISKAYEEEDIFLISKLVTHEAIGEGLNGWVGVTEVIKNRIESGTYGATVKDVVYADEQFENVEEIENIIPDERVIKVVRETLAGNISVLDENSEVYNFRNPQKDYSDWGDLTVYKVIGNHAFYVKKKI